MMKFKILVSLLIISLGLNVFLLVNGSITGQTVLDTENFTGIEVYTTAVCEGIDCHDEVFVQCGDVNTKLGNIVGNNPEFELDWEDPRT
ncbi:MAG: hypothetical protein Q8Q35_01385 [Nanoarchaeota archaeon]|nr:hypothetical protein [Nanoarchaeota archaeon]